MAYSFGLKSLFVGLAGILILTKVKAEPLITVEPLSLGETRWVEDLNQTVSVKIRGRIDPKRGGGVRFNEDWLSFDRRSGDFETAAEIYLNDVQRGASYQLFCRDLYGKETVENIDLSSAIDTVRQQLKATRELWFEYGRPKRLSIAFSAGPLSLSQTDQDSLSPIMASVLGVYEQVDIFSGVSVYADIGYSTGSAGDASLSAISSDSKLGYSLFSSPSVFRFELTGGIFFRTLKDSTDAYGYENFLGLPVGARLTLRLTDKIDIRFSGAMGMGVNSAGSASIMPVKIEVFPRFFDLESFSIYLDYLNTKVTVADTEVKESQLSLGLRYHLF